MRWEEFLDKENGTRNALLGPSMSDSDRNIMRELQHEPCEAHCEDCGACMMEDPRERADELVLCEDCQAEHDEASQERRAESIMESRHADQEAAFNARWPR